MKIKWRHSDIPESEDYTSLVRKDREIMRMWEMGQIRPTDEYLEKMANVMSEKELIELEKNHAALAMAERAVRMIEQNNRIPDKTYTAEDFIETANSLGYFYGK